MSGRIKIRAGLVDACTNPRLFGVGLWPRQRALMQAVESGPRIHVWALGRRSGKTTMGAETGLWDCLLRPELDEMVRPGETRYAVAVATNHAQAKVLVAAARSIVEQSPMLAALLESATDDELRFVLPSGAKTAFRAIPCSSRGSRGLPISCLIMDEAAHFLSDTEGYQTAERVWQALVPSTAQFGDMARVLVLSSPWGESGLFADLHGRATSGEITDAVAEQVSTAEMNPTITAEFLAAEQARDPESFRSEYLAEFVGSGGAFIDFDRVDMRELPSFAGPKGGRDWVLGLDPAFSKDPFGVALVGRSIENQDELRLVVGPVRALKPGGDYNAMIGQVADLAREYDAQVVTDQFCGVPIQSALRDRGLQVSVHTMGATSKTEIYMHLRARLYDGSLRLPAYPELTMELRRLQARYAAGRSSVVIPRVAGNHGDMGQALALAAYELRTQGAGVRSINTATTNAEPTIARGGLVLQGRKYLDKTAAGGLAVPFGWQDTERGGR